MTEEQKVGDCELCEAKNVIIEASGYHVAFVCLNCLD
jgi:hypothetical protein